MGGRSRTVSEGAGEREGESEPSTTDELSRDTVFQTLSNPRRRLALRYLGHHRGEEVRIRDLSEWIAAEENDVPAAAVSYKQRKRVYTSLYQSHLPALDRDGIVDYDRARGTVSLTSTAGAFDVYLEVVPDRALSWNEYWLGLGAVAAAFSVTAWLGFLPYFSASGHAVALIVSAVVFVSAVAFALVSRNGRL